MRQPIRAGEMMICEIDPDTLLDEVTKLKYSEWRLMQICATKTGEDSYEVLYTFGHGYRLRSIRLKISGEAKLSSITSIYPIAYLYENEMHDLFGIEIDMINIDFKGGLFRTGVKAPFK
ncbi:MAG: NADH-quinone oxidoreductase subunit C [Lachnospiraceae bacterium]|jgi:ech hydrogenase subunit D|nr:NADH-quinone oxidoreductase subunit C [Lachnospiraceae bacterium]